MTNVRHWKWKLNIPEMTCFNEENKVVVEIRINGKEVSGKILDMSRELFWKIAKHENGPKFIQQIALAAEEEYSKACSGSKKITGR